MLYKAQSTKQPEESIKRIKKMDLALVDKIVIGNDKYVQFDDYCTAFNKNPRTLRQSIKDEKVITKRFNGKTYVRI